MAVTTEAQARVVVVLAMLTDRLVKELAMLATLSFLITEEALERTRCSLRERTVIPGKGRASRVHTSDKIASSLDRSPLEGERIVTRLSGGATSDCDLWRRVLADTVATATELSLSTVVFFRTTW